mmetsp:Transcript_3259/g.11815  ORF Transcript_3259/g.11815 Transcript_3259/m.11815 type:complete len:712 (-) Transcript_3259:250-2385(-)
MDPVYDAALFAVHVYAPENIEWNARHADVMSIDKNNKPYVNFVNFNEATELAPVLHAPMENAAMPPPGHSNEKRVQVICGCARSSYFEPVDSGAPLAPLEAASYECAAVLLLLKEAKVPFDVHAIDMTTKPEWLQDLSADVKLPAVRLPGSYEWQSSFDTILEGLGSHFEHVRTVVDQRRVRRRVLPKDCDCIWDIWASVVDALGLNGQSALILGNQDSIQKLRADLSSSFSRFDDLLKMEVSNSDALFLCGVSPGLADCYCAPVLTLIVNLCECGLFERLKTNVVEMAPYLEPYLGRFRDRRSWLTCYGGGGSNGAVAMIRNQISEALQATQAQSLAKIQLFTEMMQSAREMYSPVTTPRGRHSERRYLEARMENSSAPLARAPSGMRQQGALENTKVKLVVGCVRASYGEEVDGGVPRLPLEASCCFCAKVLLLLEEADLEYTVYYVDLKNKPTWLKAVSPNLSTPAALLPGGDKWLDSSGEIITKLCETCKAAEVVVKRNRLTPLAPEQVDGLWNIWTVACKAMGLKGGQPMVLGVETRPKLEDMVRKALLDYDLVLQDEKFLCGKEPGLLDLEMAPVLELSLNLLKASLLDRIGFGFLEDAAPHTMAYLDNMKARPSWSVAYGGGGSNGFAAMIRSQIRIGLAVMEKERYQKQQLYKQMLLEARERWPPAVNSSNAYSDITEQQKVSQGRASSAGGNASIADVKLCM